MPILSIEGEAIKISCYNCDGDLCFGWPDGHVISLTEVTLNQVCIYCREPIFSLDERFWDQLKGG